MPSAATRQAAAALVAAIPLLFSPTGAQGQNRPPLPQVVLDHMQSLDARCRAAGGSPGDGRYVTARDFTGDGQLDYLLAEASYVCTGRPNLFLQNGQGRVDIFVTDRANRAHRVYSDQLTAHQVLQGNPARIRITRQGPACGTAGSCVDQLAWNGQGFGQVMRNDRPAIERPGERPGSAAAAPAATIAPNAMADFLAQCRRDYVSRDASAARWAGEQCQDDWKKVVASGLAAQALLAVIPQQQSARPTLADIRRQAPGVRWQQAKPAGDMLAVGAMGGLSVFVEGKGAPAAMGVSWMKIGAEIPYDVVNAMRIRGATMVEMSCEKLGTGEGMRAYAGTLAGHAPFTLRIDQRTAPTGNANSHYSASVSFDGRHPARGPRLGCDF